MLDALRALREEVLKNIEFLDFFLQDALPVIREFVASIFYDRLISNFIAGGKLVLNENTPLFVLIGQEFPEVPDNVCYLIINDIKELGDDPGGMLSEIIRRGGGNGIVVEVIELPPLPTGTPLVGRIYGEGKNLLSAASFEYKHAGEIFVGQLGEWMNDSRIRGFIELFLPANSSLRKKIFNLFAR